MSRHLVNELRSDCRTCSRCPTFGHGDKLQVRKVERLLGATTRPTVGSPV